MTDHWLVLRNWVAREREKQRLFVAEQQRFLERKQTVARVLERTRQTDAAASDKGGRGVEGLMHMLFAHARIRGEWFRPVPELLAYAVEIDETASCDKRDEEALFEKRRNIRIIA